jgi:hypothetical protein
MRSAVVSEGVKVVELQSVVDGRRFDCTVTENAEGKFVYDEDVRIIGPLIIFETDGLTARFIGLRDRRVLA